jgi:putative membrane protein
LVESVGQSQQINRPAQKKDSTSNLRRRYRHLFRLPARNRTIAYASAIALGVTAISRLGLSTPYQLIALYLVLTEVLLLVSVEIDRRVLHARKVATFRRLASLSILSNAFWLVLSIVGLVVSLITHDVTRLFSLVILGFFFAVGFRALIIGSLFYPKPRDALPLAFVQPILLFGPAAFSPRTFGIRFFTRSIDPATAIIGGIVALIAIEFYIASIDKIKVGTYKPFDLLQAFLNAWAAEDATNLERILETTSRETKVSSQILELEVASQSASSENRFGATIVVPGIHPGPFYPIGSSNIPADIFRGLGASNNFPMTVHSMSDHDLNLSSKKQVERYVKSLKQDRRLMDAGSTMSEPVVVKQGKATVNAIAFGKSALLTVTQAPYGMEDFPSEVRREIENYSLSQAGFSNVLVVDTHNSEGEKPNETECEDAVSAAKRALNQLAKANQAEFEAGISHSSELDEKMEQDIGPAGIGFILFQRKGEVQNKFSLVIVDANNAVIGFREKALELFESKRNSKIIEISTSDTHVTAAKTSEAKGYLALGDVITPEKFVSILVSLQDRAEGKIAPCRYSSYVVDSEVKTIGGEVLSNFSGLVDSASSGAKNGAQILGAIAFLITIIVAIL